MPKKKEAEPIPQVLKDPQKLGVLVSFLEMTGYALYKRRFISQPYDFIRKHRDLMTKEERKMWKTYRDDFKELAELSREAMKKDPPPKELAKKASEQAKKETEE